MTLETEVSNFLRDFQTKREIWGIVFKDERGKNAQTLHDLELPPGHRTKILDSIVVQDYCEGPIPDNQNLMPDLWVFGKTVKNREIYIKISMGNTNSKTICISFHTSEWPLNYPLRV